VVDKAKALGGRKGCGAVENLGEQVNVYSKSFCHQLLKKGEAKYKA
jgi:hypothetical protein